MKKIFEKVKGQNEQMDKGMKYFKKDKKRRKIVKLTNE